MPKMSDVKMIKIRSMPSMRAGVVAFLAMTFAAPGAAQKQDPVTDLRGDVIFLDGYIEDLIPSSYWRNVPEFSVRFECTGAEITKPGGTRRRMLFADCTATATPAPSVPFDQARIGQTSRRVFGWRPGWPSSDLAAKITNRRFSFTFRCRNVGMDNPCAIKR